MVDFLRGVSGKAQFRLSLEYHTYSHNTALQDDGDRFECCHHTCVGSGLCAAEPSHFTSSVRVN